MTALANHHFCFDLLFIKTPKRLKNPTSLVDSQRLLIRSRVWLTLWAMVTKKWQKKWQKKKKNHVISLLLLFLLNFQLIKEAKEPFLYIYINAFILLLEIQMCKIIKFLIRWSLFFKKQKPGMDEIWWKKESAFVVFSNVYIAFIAAAYIVLHDSRFKY